ncbi:MAG TPA: hypothetical protein VD997_07595 [Phycisphaerales bacterium]|nr:hypothetical protein [Phycisphaerales bacterium]
MRTLNMAAGLVIAATCSAAGADVLRWINPNGGAWTDASNWDQGRVPTNMDSAEFDLNATYTVTVPADPGVPVIGIKVLRGNVNIQGPGTSFSQIGRINFAFNGPGHILLVGSGTDAATLTLTRARIETCVASFSISPGSTAVMSTASSFWSCGMAQLTVPTGATLRLEGGGVSPGTLLIQGGTAIVTSGSLNGESVAVSAGSTVRLSGTGSRFSYENSMVLRGLVEVQDGAQIAAIGGPSSIPITGEGCDLRLINGTLGSPGFRGDAATTVTLTGNYNWVAQSSNSEYRGVFSAGPGGQVQVWGRHYAPAEFDQASINTLSTFGGFQGGLTLKVDGLIDPPTPVVRRSAASFGDTILDGPLVVEVRNSNALRVGDVVPLLQHQANTHGSFTSVQVPVIGGGRVLEVYAEGTPLTTYLRVAAGGPSCYFDADFNGDGDIGTDQDIEAFFACLGGTCCAACASADFNGDGDTATDQDIEAFFHVLGGGSC